MKQPQERPWWGVGDSIYHQVTDEGPGGRQACGSRDIPTTRRRSPAAAELRQSRKVVCNSEIHCATYNRVGHGARS